MRQDQGQAGVSCMRLPAALNDVHTTRCFDARLQKSLACCRAQRASADAATGCALHRSAGANNVATAGVGGAAGASYPQASVLHARE